MSKELIFKILKLVAFGVVPYAVDLMREWLRKNAGFLNEAVKVGPFEI